MLLAAARFAYPNAKIRALRASLLTVQDMHFLEESKDLKGFLSYLATTSYAPYLPEGAAEGLQGLSTLERSLARPLMEHYAKIAKAFKVSGEQALVLALFSRFEAENLKILLRCLHSGLRRFQVAHLLYPLGVLSRLPWEELWESSNISSLVARLRGRAFGRALQHALPRYEVQGNLFPLEMALDLSSFRQIEEAISRLKVKQNRKMALEIVGSYVDILNISWIIRLRRVFNLSPEEIVNYSLPGGTLPLVLIHRMARAENLDMFLREIPSSLSRALAGVRDWGEIGPQLNRWLLKRLRRIFSMPPFHVGVALAYLYEKELELRDIISLLEEKTRKSYTRQPESIREAEPIH